MRALSRIRETQHGDAATFLAAWQAATHEANGFGNAWDYCIENDCPTDVMEMVEQAKQTLRVAGERTVKMQLVADKIRITAYDTLTLTALLDMLDIQTVDDENYKKTFLRDGVLVGRYDSNEGWTLLRALNNPMTPTEFDKRFAALPKD